MKKIGLLIILFFLFTNVYAVDIKSNYMVLYNMNDDILVEEKNKDEKINIASMTKIMTAIVSIENIKDYNETFTIPNSSFIGLVEANASVAGFRYNQKVTYNDLLYGSLLPSGADATNALAIKLTGSIDKFVNLMNNKAKEIGMKNTHFSNTTGLDDEKHYSTVQDIAILLKYSLKNDKFKEIFTTKKYITSDKRLTFRSTMFKTINIYDKNIDYIKGGKTGYTGGAGRCLASISYDKDNKINYLLVTAKAPTNNSYSHIADAKTVYEYYFKNYSYVNVIENNNKLNIDTLYATDDKYQITINQEVLVYKNKNEEFDVDLEYDGINVIPYDTKKGSKLGTVKIIYNNNLVDEIDVFLEKELEFSFEKFIYINKNNILIVVFLFTIVVLLFIIIRKIRKKSKYKDEDSYLYIK